jgi:hypothetical protein
MNPETKATFVTELTAAWIVEMHGEDYIEVIRQSSLNRNNDIMLNLPGYIIPKPVLTPQLVSRHHIQYPYESIDTLAHTTVASALYQLKHMNAAASVFNARDFYPKHLDYHYCTDRQTKLHLKRRLEEHPMRPKGCDFLKDPMHSFTHIMDSIFHQNGLACKTIKSSCDIRAQYSYLRDGEMLAFMISSNSHIICLVKGYIIDSQYRHALLYSEATLNALAFGSFSTIRLGIHVYKIGNRVFINKLPNFGKNNMVGKNQVIMNGHVRQKK